MKQVGAKTNRRAYLVAVAAAVPVYVPGICGGRQVVAVDAVPGVGLSVGVREVVEAAGLLG